MAFRNLGIKEEVIKVIEEENFEKPFEIQEKAIPFVLDGKDVIAQAATGSGKTLAFGAGIIHICKREEKIQALVLVPTRELAEQVAGSMKKFSKYNFLKTTVVYGGVGMAAQIKNLKNADIVVGTPGRILDYITRRIIDLKFLKVLVLDESDRMLDMGFIRDVERIIKACPINRQTLMFSATISPEITHLAKKYMINPMKVSVESYVDPSNLRQFFYDVNEREKFSLLAHLLKNEDSELTMVFCATRRRVDIIAKKLDSQGIDILAIHGGFPQNRRLRIMEEFQNKKIRILVCTDVAARGLDIKGVSHVYNYDIPNESKDYIHRIGRTARAGEKGKAISLVSNRDGKNFENILRNPKLSIKKETLPEFERLSIETKVHDSHRKSVGRRNFRRERSIYGGRVNFGRRKGRFNRSYGNHNRDKRTLGRKYDSGRRDNWKRR
ncbi:DEAD/DEAH box helicase [Candidatus Pacearchaeota archaeon]|nr:DEAD/DEAH box helicase [Candidatus Pacearchaeota archaeon]